MYSVMFRIVEDASPPLPEECSESLQDFLRMCFNKDPTKRPSAEQLCDHEWLKKHSAAHKVCFLSTVYVHHCRKLTLYQHLQELRPQDSIPFLRRVSADMQKSKAIHFLADIGQQGPDPIAVDRRTSFDQPPSPARPRLSNGQDAISPREHSFVKTTFGKRTSSCLIDPFKSLTPGLAVICRVCLQSVKKSAVLCEQCSLIAHAKCASNAPPTCDLRSQLLLYAQYAESGNPLNPYSPMEILAAATNIGTPTSPTSYTSDDGVSRRTSMDSVQPLSSSTTHGHLHPPTAFKVFSAFKRSRSSLTIDQDPHPPPTSTPTPPSQTSQQVSRKKSVLRRKHDADGRPRSISSTSTTPNSASMRSAVTAAESMSSSSHHPRISVDATERLSRMTSFSAVSAVSGAETERDEPKVVGEMPKSRRDKRRDRESGGCTVQ